MKLLSRNVVKVINSNGFEFTFRRSNKRLRHFLNTLFNRSEKDKSNPFYYYMSNEDLSLAILNLFGISGKIQKNSNETLGMVDV